MSSVATIFRALPHFKGKFRLAGHFLKSKLNKKEVLTFKGKHGLQYSVPNTIETIGRELFINGEYERRTQAIIKQSLGADPVIFDVGANIGSITLPIARQTGAVVHAFEPSRLSYAFLERNVRDNQLHRVQLNNAAVHAKDGLELEFYEAEEKYGNSSFSATYINQPRYRVNTISLDAYCKRNHIARIDVLKIDVQGYEKNVLEGAEDLLRRKGISTILFEMEAWAERQAGFAPGASQQFLLDHQYQLFDMEGNLLTSVQTAGTGMFIARPVR